MQTRGIGSLEVSTVGLGCNNFGWRLDYSRTVAVIDAALSPPAVASVIAGATSPEQVRANVHAAGWHLSHADLDEIDKFAPAS